MSSVSIRIRSDSRIRCRECTKPRAETANRSTLQPPLPSSRDRTTLGALPMEGRSNDEYAKARADYRRGRGGRLDRERHDHRDWDADAVRPRAPDNPARIEGPDSRR